MRIIVILLTLLSPAISWAQSSGGRPTIPIIIPSAEDGADACPVQGQVVGLDPHSDGFLAVKSAPSIKSARIDKLFNGERVYLCTRISDWFGVVYTRRGEDCNVSRSWPTSMAYTGPCRSGWVYRSYVELLAGDLSSIPSAQNQRMSDEGSGPRSGEGRGDGDVVDGAGSAGWDEGQRSHGVQALSGGSEVLGT